MFGIPYPQEYLGQSLAGSISDCQSRRFKSLVFNEICWILPSTSFLAANDRRCAYGVEKEEAYRLWRLPNLPSQLLRRNNLPPAAEESLKRQNAGICTIPDYQVPPYADVVFPAQEVLRSTFHRCSHGIHGSLQMSLYTS